MSRVPKLASKAIKNQESTPLFAWIRDFFLHVKRDPITPSPGHAGPDGKAVFQSANRFPNTQSSRGVEPALAQGGVHHKIADNYYYQRDGRRDVLPPTPLYKIDTQGKLELKKPTGEAISLEQLNEQVEAMVKGPQLNYGFSPKVPTPGFSYEWTRSVGNEEPSQQVDPQMARAQKYDKFANSGP